LGVGGEKRSGGGDQNRGNRLKKGKEILVLGKGAISNQKGQGVKSSNLSGKGKRPSFHEGEVSRNWDRRWGEGVGANPGDND